MFLTEHFVFLHVPRTGGNFVRVVLEQHAPPEWNLQRLADHATVSDIPRSHASLPRLAFVRNPYDWYVSWYHFQARRRDPFFLQISENGRLPFAVTLRRALATCSTPVGAEGPYTQTLRSLLGPDPASFRIGRFERLREDLLRLLARCVEVPPAMAEAIRALPAQNLSEHASWRQYYDAELLAQITTKDREALRYFGYAAAEATSSS